MSTNVATMIKAPDSSEKHTTGKTETANMIIGMPGHASTGQEIIITTASGLKTVQTVNTAQSAMGAATSTVNASPLSKASHFNRPGDVKMIAVSSEAIARGNKSKSSKIITSTSNMNIKHHGQHSVTFASTLMEPERDTVFASLIDSYRLHESSAGFGNYLSSVETNSYKEGFEKGNLKDDVEDIYGRSQKSKQENTGNPPENCGTAGNPKSGKGNGHVQESTGHSGGVLLKPADYRGFPVTEYLEQQNEEEEEREVAQMKKDVSENIPQNLLEVPLPFAVGNAASEECLSAIHIQNRGEMSNISNKQESQSRYKIIKRNEQISVGKLHGMNEQSDTPHVKSEPLDKMDTNTDPFATFTSPALACDQVPENYVKSDLQDIKIKQEPGQTVLTKVVKKNEVPVWHDVGVINGNSCIVSMFYVQKDEDTKQECDQGIVSVDNLPDYSFMKKIKLEPGTIYKFRVAGLNSCGRGPWSEVTAFKTSLPGYPRAPSGIKILKSIEGVHLSWEPSPCTTEEIIEYSVYLAICSTTSQAQDDARSVSTTLFQPTFVQVYCGPTNQCRISYHLLTAAYVDITRKRAIILRIAACNEKGYGPATQVRWLQDPITQDSRYKVPRFC